ncbi:thrombospondin type 3 repeat-containing protein, partial [bacterium]|nr:thrombospondin type 3 repeat-containing protein [bacterium]
VASTNIDLSVESIDFESGNDLPNGIGTLSVTIKNNGDAIVNSLGVYDNDNNFAEQGFVFQGSESGYIVDRDIQHITGSHPFLSGDTLTLSWQGHFSSQGNKLLQYEVDNYNRIAETNEDNNLLESVIIIGEPNTYGLPDLTVSDISFDSANMLVNEEGGLSVTIINLGAHLTSGAGLFNAYNNFTSSGFVFSNSVSGVLDFDRSRTVSVDNPLRTGESIIFTWQGHFSEPGHLSIFFVVDNADELEELNENNNSLTKIIRILSDIDDDDDVVPHETEEEQSQSEDDDRVTVVVQPPVVVNTDLLSRVRGRILLQVEDRGEAWYVRPDTGKRIYMRDGPTAYGMMRNLGLGITNTNLEKIPVGIEDKFESHDTDGDGLSDKLEEGLGTDVNKTDTDGDGYTDRAEILNGYNPLGAGQMNYDNSVVDSVLGKIVLQVESRGEAWYINPVDGKRYYMKDGSAAYQIMRYLSLGITNADLFQINSE